MNYYLPENLEVCGTSYPILSDYRPALDIFAVLSDPELTSRQKVRGALLIFYPSFEAEPPTKAMSPEHYQEALRRCFWFLNGGEDEPKDGGHIKLIDWKQDFPLIVAPVNRVLGRDVRETGKPLHWWTFLSAFNEIGDCLFSQVVRIRNLKAKGRRLDKLDQLFYRENRHLVDFEMHCTETELEILKQWTGHGG